jgi:hypothetical protein
MTRMKKPFAGLAGLLAGTYLLLAVLSVACAFEHGPVQPSSHHHGGTVSHSSFCTWACQANPTSEAEPSVLVLHPFLVVTPYVECDHAVMAGGSGFYAASRAPPVQS